MCSAHDVPPYAPPPPPVPPDRDAPLGAWKWEPFEPHRYKPVILGPQEVKGSDTSLTRSIGEHLIGCAVLAFFTMAAVAMGVLALALWDRAA